MTVFFTYTDTTSGLSVNGHLDVERPVQAQDRLINLFDLEDAPFGLDPEVVITLVWHEKSACGASSSTMQMVRSR